MALSPTELDLEHELGLDLLTDPKYPIYERHRKNFVEKYKNADPSKRDLLVREEKYLRQTQIALWKEMDEEKKKASRIEGKASRKEVEEEDLENKPQKKLKICNVSSFCHSDGSKPMEYYHRCNRSYDACHITKRYKFVKGRKTCISSKILIVAVTEKCFDSTWVAVHGMETICMVTHRDMDMTRFPPKYQSGRLTEEEAMADFAKAVISEVECIPYDDHDYNDDDLRLRFCDLVKKPFGVVSEVEKVREKSGHEVSSYDANLAVKFLRSKVSSGLAFTDYETIQTAIGAYQEMYFQNLRAEDIWVTTFHFLSGISEHLHIDQIREQLAIVNGLSEKAPLKWPLFQYRRSSSKSDNNLVQNLRLSFLKKKAKRTNV